MLCNLKHWHSHILSCVSQLIIQFLLHQLSREWSLFIPPFPMCCSEDAFSSLLFSYPESLLSASWHTPTLLFSSLYLLLWTKIFCSFHVFHTCNPISHSPLELKHIPSTQPQMPPHTSFQWSTEVAALGSSSWLFLPQEKIEIATMKTLPLGKKQKASHTSEPHHKYPAEALPNPPHSQLSAAFSLKWDAPWHVTSFLAFSSSIRSHSSFHTSSHPELHRPINNPVIAGAWKVRPWWQRKPSSVCPQTKTP